LRPFWQKAVLTAGNPCCVQRPRSLPDLLRAFDRQQSTLVDSMQLQWQRRPRAPRLHSKMAQRVKPQPLRDLWSCIPHYVQTPNLSRGSPKLSMMTLVPDNGELRLPTTLTGRQGKAMVCVCPYVRLSVRLSPLYLLNRLTFELEFYCAYGS